jgi:diguanylate cyclase (GGDEF)-like protein
MASKDRGDILIVDDTPNNLRFLSTTLNEQGYKIRSVTDGLMALTVAQAAKPDLILLDIKMPNIDGYEVCQRLKINEQTREIPVIFLSALDEVLDKVKGFTVGGVDYITKPFQLEEVLARIETHLSLRFAQREIYLLNAELEERVRQRTAQLEKEIGKRLQTQQRLLHIALHDILTGLPNRVGFMKELDNLLKQVKPRPDHQFAVLLLDGDRFQSINDSLGHSWGDRLLVAITHRIESCLPPGNTLARLGGDEFAILLKSIESVAEANQIAERIHQELSFPFQLGAYEIFTNVSIGIVVGSGRYEQPEHLLRDADTAMYQAKAKGKACTRVFEPTMHRNALSNLHLETNLRQALERDEFTVYYQPIVSSLDYQLVGFEALVRWVHPEKGFIPPDRFIPVAEASGLVMAIDLYVMRQACLELRNWQTEGLADKSLTISVNLSAKHFISFKLVEQIDAILLETELDGQNLRLEITETEIMRNPEIATQIIEKLKERHIQVIIDDFGTGYSSLSYLHRLPIDTIKIDRSFINRIGTDGENIGIVQAIMALANSLGMNAIAEGVETVEQLEPIENLNCQFCQGFLFSKPLEAQAVRNVLATGLSMRKA